MMPRSQLHASFPRFERDAVAVVTTGVILRPDSLSISLGRLNIPTQSCRVSFRGYLHSLDLRKMLREAEATIVPEGSASQERPMRKVHDQAIPIVRRSQ